MVILYTYRMEQGLSTQRQHAMTPIKIIRVPITPAIILSSEKSSEFSVSEAASSAVLGVRLPNFGG